VSAPGGGLALDGPAGGSADSVGSVDGDGGAAAAGASTAAGGALLATSMEVAKAADAGEALPRLAESDDEDPATAAVDVPTDTCNAARWAAGAAAAAAQRPRVTMYRLEKLF